MKRILMILLVSAVVFAFLTWSTAKIETPIDGHDTYGFPLTFHIRYSGMCDPCPKYPTETNYLYLLVDIAVALGAGFVIWKLIRFLRHDPAG